MTHRGLVSEMSLFSLNCNLISMEVPVLMNISSGKFQLEVTQSILQGSHFVDEETEVQRRSDSLGHSRH